jgi:hypothetical protein
VAQELVGVLGVGVLGEDDDAHFRMVCADAVCRLDALHVVSRRHADVGDRGVG